MTARRAAFDPSRLNDEIDDLLPPPLSVVPAGAAGTPDERRGHPVDDRVVPQRQPAAGSPAGQRQVAAPAASDRAAATSAADGPTTVVAVRVPRALYEAVVRDLLGPLVERPSYAQIVAWTCQDHLGEVHAELHHQVATEARAPRGRRIAADSVPLTPRFLAAELALVDAIINGVARTTSKVTRTAAVVAALRVAVKQGIGPTG
ncbi:MAG TPA: hypothetical protein VIJ47_16375 [Acidimicrobiales bacterium]